MIDENAQRHFKNSIPAEWVVNPFIHDYGKDYHVEPTGPAGQVTRAVYVQLKGTGRCRYVNGKAAVSFSLERKHLTHYMTQASLPVFLVVIDVPARQGFWVFLQQHLTQNPGWETADSYSVRIPTANRLEDSTSFTAAIADALDWMVAVQQKPARERVQEHIRELEAKDPRFRVKAAYTALAEYLTLVPTQPVSLRLGITPRRKQLKAKMRSDLFDRGVPVRFAAGELQVEGSGLISEIFGGGGTVQLTVRADAQLDLSAVDGNQSVSTWPGLTGEIAGGLKEYHYTSRPGRCPIRVAVGPFGAGSPGTIRLAFDASAWEGQPIRGLNYFDRVRSLFTALLQHPDLVARCEIDGRTLFSVTARLDGAERFAPVVAFLDVVRKAGELAAHFGIDPVYSLARFDPQTIRNIEIAHGIVTVGRYEMDSADWRVDVTFDKAVARRFEAEGWVPQELILGVDGHDNVPFLDRSVDLGHLAWTIADAILYTPKAELRRRLAARGDTVAVSFRTPERSRWVLRKVSTDEWREFRGQSSADGNESSKVLIPPPSVQHAWTRNRKRRRG